MTLEAILEPLDRIEIVVPPSSDSRRIFSEVAALYDNRKVELTAERHIIVMAPTGLDGGYISGEVFGQLREWAKRDGSGKPFDSSSGFYISPEENRSPDASWVSNERIAQIPKADRKSFAPFCPDFAIEIKSPSNNIHELREKCLRYLECGAEEVWLIDPAVKMVEVLSSGRPPRLLFDVPSVTGAGRFSTFTLDLTEIWKGL